MLSGPPRRGRTERGSVALAVIVMVLMATMGAVLVERTISDARQQRNLQARDEALALTDLAGAAAIGRISVGETVETFEVSGSTGDDRWSAVASRSAPQEWEVTARGEVPSARRRVHFLVVRDARRRWVVREWREVPVADP